MAGRKPKPTAVKKLEGNPDKRKKKEAPEPVILPEMVLQVYFEVSISLSLRYSARL